MDLSSSALGPACSIDDILHERCTLALVWSTESADVAGAVTVSSFGASEPVDAAITMARALARGDSTMVSGDALRGAIRQTFVDLAARSSAIVDAFFQTNTESPLTGLTWDPSHDSVFMAIQDTLNMVPVVVTNANKRSNNGPRILGAAGRALGGLGGRTVVFGGNVFHTTSTASPPSSMVRFVRNAITWLNGGVDPATLGPSFRIATAHLPGQSTYWFPHDTSTRNWLLNQLDATVLPMNSCEGPSLASCLATSDLLVLSCADDKAQDSLSPYDSISGPEVAAAVADFLLRGKPVLYVHYNEGNTAVSRNVLPLLGIGTISDNYWEYAWWSNADASAVTGSVSPSSEVQTVLDTITGVTPLATEDFSGCTSSTAWTSCTASGFSTKLRNGLNNIGRSFRASRMRARISLQRSAARC